MALAIGDKTRILSSEKAIFEQRKEYLVKKSPVFMVRAVKYAVEFVSLLSLVRI